MPLLDHHVAVITGAGSGIGRAIAIAYGREGARVVVADRDGAAAGDAAAEISRMGAKASAVTLDITRRRDCHSAARRVEEEIGAVSILVNNAGIVRRHGITAPDKAASRDWDAVIATNLDGMFNVTRAFLGQLRRRRGRIVNVGSVLSVMHGRTPLSPAYTTSKHGVLGFTRALAAELGREGVRVNAIGPGFTATALNAAVRDRDDPRLAAVLDHIPLGRMGTVDDLVGPAVFLASDLSGFVTGTILLVDGGYHII
ncbi:MAG: SDR family oxidoreductase [Rhodobacteraceae bacterium]|nr:SDR family oxidoreductase [Paracoccaceae bacterium]